MNITTEQPNNVLKIENARESDCGNYTCMTGDAEVTIAVRSK